MKKSNVFIFAFMALAMILTGCDSSKQGDASQTSNNAVETNQTTKTVESEPAVAASPIPEAGSVWSYTQHLFYETGNFDVKTYFVFKSNNEVLWLYGTPKGHMFPMGYGSYNQSTNKISFSSDYPLHKRIAAYYGHSDPIVFNFDARAMTAKLNTDGPDWQGTSDGIRLLKDFYNDGQTFSLTKENYTMNVKEDLVGTKWLCQNEYGDTYFTFKSWNEVVILDEWGEESCLYVLLNNLVSIKIGDGWETENLIGVYYGENEMTLCVDGLLPEFEKCITLRKLD